jgi:hypothetical protein
MMGCRIGPGRLEGPNLPVLIILHQRPSLHVETPPAVDQAATSCSPPQNSVREASGSIAPVVSRVASPRMATAAAAALRYFPSPLRNRDPGPTRTVGLATPSSRRRHCAAAVAAPSREAEPSSSLGHLTRADFPILHQVSYLLLPVSL